MKPCTKCKIIKDLFDFYKDKRMKSGRSSSCKRCKDEARRINYIKNKDRELARRREWEKKNRKKITESYMNRHRACPILRIKTNLRRRLHKLIEGTVNGGSAISDLGCSPDQLKQYLESKFQEGMSWETYGNRGWHIDHIIPLSSFDLTNREQLLKACHYTNLQPLWWIDNIKKSNKVV